MQLPGMLAAPASDVQDAEGRDGEGRDDDLRFMAAALNLARRGLGRVAPNPAVGALVVKDGVVIGRGWTADGGRPHAEPIALAAAGEAAAGATLYVTLEPCSHHGRTPPCAEAITKAGIGRVVSALEDPDPRVAGQGHKMLRDAGIALRTGVLAEAAGRLNLGHILRRTQHRPMITLKLAETANGYAAGPQGAPRLKITGESADRFVHMQRALHDAILIGSKTALADDPLLTVRLPGMESIKPLRIVLDSKLILPLSSRLVATAKEHPVLLLAAQDAAKDKAAALADKGVALSFIATDAAGMIDLAAALRHLASAGLTRIFCEGGPQLAEGLLSAGAADEVLLLTGAEMANGGLASLSNDGRALLHNPSGYRLMEDRRLGEDRLRRYERCL